MNFFKKMLNYLKDLQFSRMLVKYFLILLLVLILPVTCINGIYQYCQQKSQEERLIQNNEQSLKQIYNVADSVFVSAKNLLYSLGVSQNMQYLATSYQIENDNDKAQSLEETFSLIKKSNNYMDSIGAWFKRSDMTVSNRGVMSLETYDDLGWKPLYDSFSGRQIVCETRKKHDIYPYLLTFLFPISSSKEIDFGAVFINIDLEKLGEYLGTGRYQTKDESPILLIFEKENGNLVYSDEYRYWKTEGTELEEIWRIFAAQELPFSEKIELQETKYIASAMTSSEGFLYIYLSPYLQDAQKLFMMDGLYQKMFWIPVVLCGIVAFMFAIWIYKPIQKTMKLLDSFSMLIKQDGVNGMDEIESIQRSILHIKEHSDSQNELLQERMLSLRNAQICALQTQINPHFLYNCLESIGTLTAIMLGEETNVTEAIFTLGKLMRISLSGKNYLVLLEEELEHVSIYIRLMELIEPEFRKRVQLHIDIPQELRKNRIIKLTLQPIIENALEHGLSGKRREGNIWITGEKKDNYNYLYIMDDGSGVSDIQLEKLRESLKESSITSSKHIGLRNVDQRLKLVFGEDCGILVDQKEYFVVTVRFGDL